MKQLRAFVAVAETSSFSRASEQLHIAQSAISLLVKELETELSARLFDRTTRRVELTAAGREFRPHAEKILSDLRHAVEDTHALGEKRRGRLTVAGPPLLMEAFFPRVLVPFKRDFPGVRVVMIDGRTERVVEAVKSGEADLGVGTFPNADDDLVRTHLVRDDLMLFCASDHPLAKHAKLKWADIQNVPLIAMTHDSGIRQLVDYGCNAAGFSANAGYEVSFVTTALALVEVGVGVSVLPANAVSVTRGRAIVARSLGDPTVGREIDMITRHGRSLSPAAAEWVRRLKHDIKDILDVPRNKKKTAHRTAMRASA